MVYIFAGRQDGCPMGPPCRHLIGCKSQVHTVATTLPNLYELYVMEKNRYLGLMRPGTKTDMSTCLSAPTGRASVVKRATIVVHSVSHTSTYMKSHIPNIK